MRWKYLLPLLFFGSLAWGQTAAWDTLDIQYRLLQNNYSEYEDIIKIKLPPYLSTAEAMRQVKLAVHWPGDPPPRKKTKVYVFRDDAAMDAVSTTGALYTPGKGYRWAMNGWAPDTTIFSYEPSTLDRLIYESYIDSIITNGMQSMEFENSNHGVKKRVAEDFRISVTQLDSIFYRVKWWSDLVTTGRKRNP